MAKKSSAKKGKKGKKGKKSRSISVDMEGVESGGRIPDGDHLLEVDEITVETGDKSKKDYLKFVFKLVSGGGKVFHNCSLQPQALFNLRSTLEALGMEVPDSSMDIDLDDLAELRCGGTIENETYEGKKRPQLIDLFPESELDGEDGEDDDDGDEEEEEEEEKPKSKKGKKGKIKVGSTVTFEDDEGDEATGEVTEIEDDIATVTDEDEEEWELDLADLTLS